MSLGYGRVERQLLDEIAKDGADRHGYGVLVKRPGMGQSEVSSRRRAAKRLEEKGMCETLRVVVAGRRRLVCMTPEKALDFKRSQATDRMAGNKLERLNLNAEFSKLGLDTETWKPIDEEEGE